MSKLLICKGGALLLAVALTWGGAASAADTCTKPECWGAVGIGPGDAYGYSYHYGDRNGAIERVRSQCPRCDRIEPFANSCASLASAGNGSAGFGTGPDKQAAQNTALTACRSDGGLDCKTRVWGCSRRAD